MNHTLGTAMLVFQFFYHFGADWNLELFEQIGICG